MRIQILAVYENLDEYCNAAEKDGKMAAELWEKEAVAPYWKTLCQYAPMDLSDRKPRPITDIKELRKQIALLKQIDKNALEQEFNRIAEALPPYDDDPIYVAIYPLSNSNITVKEQQNGVIGTSTFGNIMIQVNPFAVDYEKWIPYVFAHEYHHTIFGAYWYGIHGGELTGQFIEALLTDGEADHFALSFYPDLKPKWLFQMTEEEIFKLFEEKYADIVKRTDVDYVTYMFGKKEKQIPWCAGYAVGFFLISQYQKINPQITYQTMLEEKPVSIYEKVEKQKVVK
ncbi:MAG: hypothetical protein E7256_02780 [Lachnospiraceae bacterium]|nr:hypothetical protein [Lachnospiraceae bacterium]